MKKHKPAPAPSKSGPRAATIAKIHQAAACLAGGKTFAQTAEAVGVSTSTLRGIRNRHKVHWQQAVDAASAGKKLPEEPQRSGPRREPFPAIASRLHQAIRLHVAGKPWTEAATVLGIAAKTLEKNRTTYREWCAAEIAVARSELQAAGHDLQQGLSEKMKERTRQATSLLAAGLRFSEIAEQLGVSVGAIEYCRKNFPGYWRRELERAMRAAEIIVTRSAGTSAVLDDPTAYLRQASAVDRWARSQDRELFAPNGEMTLTRFYNEWYLPVRLEDASPDTQTTYQATLNRWRLLTGDPPLKEITAAILGHFRDALKGCRVRKGLTIMSPTTIRRHLRHVNALLNKAGPPGYRNRDAAGVIPGPVPWVKSPREVVTPPRIVTEEEITACYNVAGCMDVPTGPHCRPGDWWRAILVAFWNTGQRVGTMLALQWPWVDFKQGRATIPPKAIKSRRLHVIPLNETVLRHLREIRRSDGHVFAWPFCRKTFNKYFHRLQDLAGIPKDRHFGTHAIRKTVATRLWTVAPEAAVLALGHTAANVTMRHYVEGPSIVARAFERLDQPAAFEKPTQ